MAKGTDGAVEGPRGCFSSRCHVREFSCTQRVLRSVPMSTATLQVLRVHHGRPSGTVNSDVGGQDLAEHLGRKMLYRGQCLKRTP